MFYIWCFADVDENDEADPVPPEATIPLLAKRSYLFRTRRSDAQGSSGEDTGVRNQRSERYLFRSVHI